MEMNLLVILAMAFGLFAILMFILFYIYAKKYYNDKHISDDYEDNTLDEKIELVSINIDGVEQVLEADGEILKEGENVSVIINNKSHKGIVTKANYEMLLSELDEKPKKLILQKEAENENIEFVPKKKK